MRRLAVCAVVLILASLVGPVGAAEYTVRVIATNANAYSINSSNDITGRVGSNPAIWHGVSGTPTVLSVVGVGFDINESGHVAVGDFDSSNPYISRFWDGVNPPLQMPTLGGYHCRAEGINGLDQIAGYSRASDGYYHSFIWSLQAGIRSLGHTGGSDFAYGINDAGQVVGSWSLSNGGLQAFVWDNAAGFHPLPTLGGWAGDAVDINNRGQIAGTSCDASDYWRATLWDASGVPRNVGTVDGRQSFGLAINNNGWVIGRIEDAASRTLSHPFVWDAVRGLRQLPEPAGYKDCFALGINDNGWIVGFARAYDYHSDAIVWIPVPEPSSLLALVPGLLGAGVALRRKRMV